MRALREAIVTAAVETGRELTEIASVANTFSREAGR